MFGIEETKVANPIPSLKYKVTTIGQLNETNRIVAEIINNLSNEALGEMLSGTGSDVDNLFQTIYEETFKTLYGELGLVTDSSYFYLDHLSKSIEETFRIENINYFILSTMPEFEINWHHLEWGQMVMRLKKFGVLAARDLGKSYYFSNAYPIWKMYRYKPMDNSGFERRPDLAIGRRGYLITNSEDLAIDLLEILKSNIESNPELHEKLFPINSPTKIWGQKSIKTKTGARFSIKSYGSAFRGRHPGYLVVDDFLTDNILYSSLQRQKAIDWFHSVLMNALLKQGQTCVVGTPFHTLDLYGDLKQKKGWKVVEYPAIYPDGKLTWKNRYNYYDIMRKREEQGNLIFSREILCRPIVSDSSIFPYEILQRSFINMNEFTLVSSRENYLMKFDKVVVGCDFAMSSSVGADFSVFTVWGISDKDDMYLMYFWRGKGISFREQITTLKSININFRPDLIVCESNQFQRIFVEEADQEGLPVVPHVTTAAKKNDLMKGLPGVAIMFERMKIKFPRGDEYSRNVTDLICSEFSSVAFTDKGLESVGGHDDCCMSTWQGMVGKRKISNVVLGFMED